MRDSARDAAEQVSRLARLLRRTVEEPPLPQGNAGVGVAFHAIAAASGRFLLIVAALFVLWRMLDAIGLVTYSLTVAVMISALLRPMVSWLVNHGVARWFAGTVVFLLGVGVITVMGWFVVSRISTSSEVIAEALGNANTYIFDWLKHGPAKMTDEQVDSLSYEIGQRLNAAGGQIATSIFTTATTALTIISGAILCLFALLFLLLDDGSIWRWLVSLFPPSAHDRAVSAGAVAWKTLVAYMRSTVLLAVLNALTMVIVMKIMNMPLIEPLGVLLFIGSLIPMVGMIVAGAVLVIVAMVMTNVSTAIVILVALVLTIQIEGNLVLPLILGKAVNIHPLAILATVTAGTLAGGIFGAFVAVPLVAVVNNVAGALRPSEADLSPVALIEPDEVAEGEHPGPPRTGVPQPNGASPRP